MNNNCDYYYIIAFETTTNVMQAEALLKQHFPVAVMPIPREINSGCGLSLRFMDDDEAQLFDYLKSFSIPGTLYKMGTVKDNDGYPVNKIMTFPNM